MCSVKRVKMHVFHLFLIGLKSLTSHARQMIVSPPPRFSLLTLNRSVSHRCPLVCGKNAPPIGSEGDHVGPIPGFKDLDIVLAEVAAGAYQYIS